MGGQARGGMMNPRELARARELWGTWRDASRAAAERRWHEIDRIERPRCSGKKWLEKTQQCLVRLSMLGILQPRESGRIAEINFGRLANSDQDRLKSIGAAPHLFAFAISSDGQQPHQSLAERFLSLNSSNRLRDGRLSLQVFVCDDLPIGMNIQLRGTDPAREHRLTYIRYDLDVVAIGAAMGPVTHFNAHWHTGDDPDAKDAEVHDPRFPSLPLDPIAVLQFLVETYYPNGPADLI